MATLENVYGIDLTYYARVNFTSLITIVDALGGVDVNSEYAFEAGGYQFQQGINTLNGDQALAFSRERYSSQRETISEAGIRSCTDSDPAESHVACHPDKCKPDHCQCQRQRGDKHDPGGYGEVHQHAAL